MVKDFENAALIGLKGKIPPQKIMSTKLQYCTVMAPKYKDYSYVALYLVLNVSKSPFKETVQSSSDFSLQLIV